MVGSKCSLKTHVRYLGYPFPLQIGGPRTTFLGRLRNLTAPFVAYIFGMKHDIDNRSSALTTTRGFLHRLKMSWTLVHKRLQTRPPFLPTLCKFCIMLHCQASQTEISKRNSTKLCQLMDSQSPYQTAVQKSEPSLPQNLGAKKLLHLLRFSTTSTLSGEYLLNETWHRQSEKGVWNYKGLRTSSENFVNFGPQTA